MPFPVLAEVRTDKVVLRKEGKYEVLRFSRGRQLALADRDSSNDAALSTKRDSSDGAPSSARLNRYRELLRTEPHKMLEYIQVVPVGAGGSFRGYRVLPGKDRALYHRLGLEPADIVTRVNGIPLRGPRQAAPILQALARADHIVAQVVRGGRPHILRVDLR